MIMICTLASRILYLSISVYELQMQGGLHHGLFEDHCMYIMVYLIPIYMFPIAAFVNLSVWCNFVMGTRTFFRSHFDRYTQRKRRLMFTLCVVVVVFVLVPMMLNQFYWCEYNKFWTLSIYNCLLYAILAVLFSVIGRVLLTTLQMLFFEFYLSTRSEILCVVITLTLAMSLRSILNLGFLLYEDKIQEWYYNSLQDNSWGAPLYDWYFALLADILPNAAQIVSFRFSVKERAKALCFLAKNEQSEIETEELTRASYMWSDF